MLPADLCGRRFLTDTMHLLGKAVHSMASNVRSLLPVAIIVMASSGHASTLIPERLRCEYHTNPIGVDVEIPRLSWEFQSLPVQVRGERKQGVRILVASSEEKLQADKGDLWDSGKVNSDETIGIEYAGRKLCSSERCWWKVKVWDQDGRESEWSRPASWTMGLLAVGDWLLDGGGRFFDLRGAPKLASYKDVSESADPEVVEARKRFELLLKDIPLPDENDPLTRNAWQRFRKSGEKGKSVNVFRPE